MKAKVYVTLKQGVLDPQGKAIQHSFELLGYEGIADVRQGKYFELDIERPSIPNVEAWYRRLQDRQAYREHVMVPFDDLRGRLRQ